MVKDKWYTNSDLIDRVQKPPNFLDRMNSRYLKQVAYNDRVIEAEREVAASNCEATVFLSEMTFDPAEQVIVCVNGSEEMTRGKAAVAGPLLTQGERRMRASNIVQQGMANTRESAILSAAVEDALENTGGRSFPSLL
jgi:hypothetical protein